MMRIGIVVPCALLVATGSGFAQAPLRPPVFAGRLHATGSGPRAVIAADFDGDGRLDVATANTGSCDMSVLHGDGACGLLEQVRYPVEGSPTALVAADWNGDGRIDLAAACADPPCVSLLIGTGRGDFEALPGPAMETRASRMWTADADGDGHADLLLGLGHDGLVLLKGDGQGGFAAPGHVPVAGGVAGAAVGDLNGDGVPDLIVSSSEAPTMRLLGDGRGGFDDPACLIDECVAQLVLVDANGDGALDMIAVDGVYAGPVSIRLGDGHGSLGPPRLIDGEVQARGVAVVRWNADAAADLMLDGLQGPLVLAGDGRGGFRREDGLVSVSLGTGIATGDFDGDGFTDAAFTAFGADGVVVLSGHEPFLSLAHDEQLPAQGDQLVVEDLDGDGRLDVLSTLSDAEHVAVLRGDGRGGFGPAVALPANARWREPLVRDVDRDGAPDIFVAGAGYGPDTTLFAADIAAADSSEPDLPLQKGFTPPTSIALGDLNGDGLDDLVVVSWFGSVLRFGTADGGFTPAVWLDHGELRAVGVVDLNGDGRLDIVAGGDALPRLVRWLAQPDGTRGEAQAFDEGWGACALAIADFDEDGRADCATIAALSGV
ncbi:MAG TPA: VCBS repeat-containing protein, partial [Planctomycetota bacterium]|nr:VCBS repeat-containing protein [Planctomycetota bacterium]